MRDGLLGPGLVLQSTSIFEIVSLHVEHHVLFNPFLVPSASTKNVADSLTAAMNRAYDTNDAAMEDSEEDENVTQIRAVAVESKASAATMTTGAKNRAHIPEVTSKREDHISKMGDCETEDMRIWTQSETDKTNYRGTQWLFGPGVLYICEEEEILTIQVNSQVHSELALFDMMCTFWRMAPFLAEHHTLDLHFRRMTQYHSILHDKVTRVLKDAGPNEHDRSPLLLCPWLRRSLFRYQHDDESRKKLQDISVPAYLVNSGAFLRIGHIHLLLFYDCFSSSCNILRTRLSGLCQFLSYNSDSGFTVYLSFSPEIVACQDALELTACTEGSARGT